MKFKNFSNGKMAPLKASSETIILFFLELWEAVGKNLNRTLLLQGMDARNGRQSE